MEPNFSEVLGVLNGFDYYDGNIFPNPIPDPFHDLGFGVHPSSDSVGNPDFFTDPPLSVWCPSHDQCSPSGDENYSTNPLLNYVSEILMEENMADQPPMFYDSLALRQTEEMFQQVISDSQAFSYSPHNSIASTTASLSFDACNSADTVDLTVDSGSESNVVLQGSNILPNWSNGQMDLSVNEILVSSMFSDAESRLQFQKGVEEAKKFLPNADHWTNNRNTKVCFPIRVSIKSDTGLDRIRKKHDREESDIEETSIHKQSATNVEEGNVTELFDKVLLLDDECDPPAILENVKASNGTWGLEKKGGRGRKKKSEAVDFRTLLILCAQAISTGDRESARDLLNQIRQKSSPLGDASQRLAHCFANGLEARLRGSSTGPVIQTYYDSLASKKTTAADILKAYKAYLTASPFMTLIYFFANKEILDASKDASVLHIIDFGILYGFQWPMFIQYISNNKIGPSKLRITGIELPQCGFRPAERIEETGRRLADYCKRFGVPFEYNAIASQNWETIRIEDLKIRANEVLAVNCGMRLESLEDETTGKEDCPRDDVLRLIRSMNPSVFTHSIVNGSFNAPFFTARFKEALFHYSAFFDMFDSTLPREDPERLRCEREFYGREAMNVIACEGTERVERPETYKQWQVRMGRAGFRQKPVEVQLVECFRGKLKRWGYHKDFVVDEDSNWVLQGWKGRILFASSCWLPA